MKFLDYLEMLANEDHAEAERMLDQANSDAAERMTKEVLLQLVTDVLVKINPDLDRVEDLINGSVRDFIEQQSDDVKNDSDVISLIYLAGETLLDTMKEYCSPRYEVATIQ